MTTPKFPQCPTCGSTGVKCRRPSGHTSMAEWHAEREDLAARACMCTDVCQPWLSKRGLLEVTA